MQRLELTKGLAASAVAALAVSALATGVSGPASAAGPGVVFMSLHNQGSDASLRTDGRDNAVSLAAMRLDPAAAITFEYNASPDAVDATAGWTEVPGTVTMTGDYAELSWEPADALKGKEVAVRAVATVGGVTTYATRQGVVIARADWGTESVAVNRQLYTDLTSSGYFDQPYTDSGRTATRMAVSGLTSATGGNAEVSWWNPATHTFQGAVDAAVQPSDIKPDSSSTPLPGGGVFSADLDITAFDADAGDSFALSAELDTDDVRAVTLYPQSPGTIDASGAEAASGQPRTITITVYDAGPPGGGTILPMAGVEVRRADGSLVGYTDGAGQVDDQTVAGAEPASYYANGSDDLDAYDPATDVQTSAVGSYSSTAAALLPAFVDGRVFDDDEYAVGDVYLVATDGSDPVPGASVDYRVYPTGTTPPATYQTAVSDSRGRSAVAFAPQGPDGDYTIDFRLTGGTDERSVTFTAGEATLGLTPAAGAAAPGGQVAFKASLVVAGKPLPGRRVGATYTRGVELAPGTTADAGLVDGANRVLSLNGTTDPLGAFTVSVRDPAEDPQGAEKGGRLTLATLAAAAGRLTLTGNANETVSTPVSFGTKKGRAVVHLKGSSHGAKDKLVVKAPDSVAGETVAFFRVVRGELKPIKSKTLGSTGDITLRVKDRNGTDTTTYVVRLVPSERVRHTTSKKVEVE